MVMLYIIVCYYSSRISKSWFMQGLGCCIKRCKRSERGLGSPLQPLQSLQHRKRIGLRHHKCTSRWQADGTQQSKPLQHPQSVGTS